MKSKVNRDPGNFLTAPISKPLTVLWFVGVLALIVVSVIPQAGFSEIDSGFGKDKIARIILFCVLAFYPAAFFPSIRMGLITSTSVAPLGFLLELLQRYVPGRNFSPEDMIANNAGAVIGILLALTVRFFFRTGRRKQRGKTETSDSGFVPMEHEKPGEQRQEDGTMEALNDPGSHGEKSIPSSPPVTKTPKKSWRTKLVVFLLLLVVGYFAWEILMPYEPAKRSPAPRQHYPAETAKNVFPIKDIPEPRISGKSPSKRDLSSKNLPIVSAPPQGSQTQQKRKTRIESEDIVEPESSATPGLREIAQHGASKTPPAIAPDPESGLVSVPMGDLLTPFSQPELQISPAESLPGTKTLADQGVSDSDETPITRKIETTTEKVSDMIAPAVSVNQGFSLQVGAFLKKKNAEDLVSNLKKKGYEPCIFKKPGTKNRTFYAVHLSDHGDFAAAAAAAKIFRNKEKAPIVIIRKESLEPVVDGLKK